MSKSPKSRSGSRVRCLRATIEVLEHRTLPSVNLVEAEPNDTTAQANGVPHVLDTQVHVSGRIAGPGDVDWYAIHLDRGDVIGATLTGQNGLNPALRMIDAAGDLMMASDDSMQMGAQALPAHSPLRQGHPSDTDSELYYVISAAGTYYLQSSASGNATAGKYTLDVMVVRPGLEARPVGTRQILYLDFDGAGVNFNRYNGHDFGGQRVLSPLSATLPDWGLTAADEDALIDAVVAKVTDKLSTYVAANGLNGDFATTGVPGQFGVEIRNSRDDPDEFGTNPLVSRVVVGSGLPPDWVAQAQDTDVGNLVTDDEAFVTVDFITAGLSLFSVQPPATALDFAAAGISAFVAHEAGHIFGCFHTEPVPNAPAGVTPSLMAHELTDALIASFGPDGVFGNADDGVIQLGVGTYWGEEPFRGRDDTLNTVAFGLSTGTGEGGKLRDGSAGGRVAGIETDRATPGLQTGGSAVLGANGGWGGSTTQSSWGDSVGATPGRPAGQYRTDRTAVPGDEAAPGGGEGDRRRAVISTNDLVALSGVYVGDPSLFLVPARHDD